MPETFKFPIRGRAPCGYGANRLANRRPCQSHFQQAEPTRFLTRSTLSFSKSALATLRTIGKTVLQVWSRPKSSAPLPLHMVRPGEQ